MDGWMADPVCLNKIRSDRGVAAAKYHSIVLGADGKSAAYLEFDLRCQQLYSLCRKNFVSIAAGKYWAAAVTTTGDVYMWDGKKVTDKLLSPTGLHGVKKATSVSVAETHLLIVGSLYHPAYACKAPDNRPSPVFNGEDPMDELTDDILFGEVESDMSQSIAGVDESASRSTVPSLKSLCEKAAAECLVEPRNAMQLLEIADSLEADELRKHCEDIVIQNLDYIFAISPQSIVSASLDVLVKLEKLLDLNSSESWSYRHLPTPTATFPAVINSEEEDSDSDLLRTRCAGRV
ncbi:hypothetical protein MLD38_004556 [Melastoma candidum]|uniref:Uncharacterized protein n=1 Tax=Melastoma candidum TaxID=119954 RepID=A0ACB9S5K0_9MYRT|nr:hypothetical protein MLD38_004556 [Melastoma candidum]